MTTQISTPKGTISIRPANKADATELRELRFEALLDTPQAFAADYTEAQADPVEVWVERIHSYALENTGILSIACLEDRLVGMTGLARGSHSKTRHSGWIWGVYVSPELRGMHIGEALVVECLAWAQAQGLRVVKLSVITSNTPAIRCYTRCGFSVFGVEPPAIAYDGVLYDELLMAKSM